jgi:L-ascorbate metabolism protein UlaG (beta-lactamase superfamily)
MQTEITYIFHNCFVLKLSQKTFLFDYPADEYLNDCMRTSLIDKIKDTDLYVFSSHNHKDHFNRNITDLNTFSRNITYILSKDIVKKNPAFKELPSCIITVPDQSYQIGDLTVRTFLSNDQGVAFLITSNNLNIYFGGDLANWEWDDLTQQESRFLVDYFSEVLNKLKQWPIQIAFSNTDSRLKNWSGAAQFIKTIKPNLFVPMHTFGETQTITNFITENPHLDNQIFHYQKTGDTLVLELPL